MSSARHETIYKIEELVTQLLQNLRENLRKTTPVTIKTCLNKYYDINNGQPLEITQNVGNVRMPQINYNHLRSRYRFWLVLYMLSVVHRQFVAGGCFSTCRELYYKNTLLIHSKRYLDRALLDVCSILQTVPWNIGFFASAKGLIAGNLRLFLKNGDIIDCSMFENGATLIPQNISIVDNIETNASFVLLVEKDTIFSKLLSQHVNGTNDVNVILVTGRGYPDLSTRAFVQRLHYECHLPIYALFDADPCGIEILLVYQHGARSTARSFVELVCPPIKWIGIHPSEIIMLNIPSVPFNQFDNRKLESLLNFDYLLDGMRQELEILQRLQLKTQIEGILHFSLKFLVRDYIPNKVKRNILL